MRRTPFAEGSSQGPKLENLLDPTERQYQPMKLSRRKAKSVTKVNRLQCTMNLLQENMAD